MLFPASFVKLGHECLVGSVGFGCSCFQCIIKAAFWVKPLGSSRAGLAVALGVRENFKRKEKRRKKKKKGPTPQRVFTRDIVQLRVSLGVCPAAGEAVLIALSTSSRFWSWSVEKELAFEPLPELLLEELLFEELLTKSLRRGSG